MNKYEQIFENAPISIWEEDWNEVKILLDELRTSIPPENLMTYFDEHPSFVKRLANAIKVLRVNKKTLEIHEAEREEELINVSIVDTFSDESFLTFKEEMVALYRGDKEFEMEAQTKTLKGNPLYVIVHIHFPSKDDHYDNVIIVMRDITPDKKNHKEYLETKAKFNRSFYQGVVGMAITDVDGHIIEVNDSFCEFLGYTKEEMLSLNISRLQDLEHGDPAADMSALLENGDSNLKGERLLIKKNGEKAWAYIGLNLMKDESGHPLYFVGQVVDIDQEKRSSLIHENNVLKYKQLLDSTHAIYLILDEEGDIKEFCETFLELFGGNYNKACLDGKSLRALISTESMPVFDEAWGRINEGHTVSCVEIALTKGDSFRWVSMNASMLQNGGKKIFILLTDITARKRKEFERLIAKEKHRDKLRNNITDLRNTIERMGNR